MGRGGARVGGMARNSGQVMSRIKTILLPLGALWWGCCYVLVLNANTVSAWTPRSATLVRDTRRFSGAITLTTTFRHSAKQERKVKDHFRTSHRVVLLRSRALSNRFVTVMNLVTDGNSKSDSDPLALRQPLVLYNSRTRDKEPFQPVRSDQVSMYTCGPTVYDSAHVGNFRAFLTYDLVKRVLTYLGYKNVVHVCNLTDVDDKILKRANDLGLDNVMELTRKYEKLFMEDLRALNIIPATLYPRATEHIYEMMDMIRILAQKGLAYETPDGSWYFRTQAQEGYGQQLVLINYDEMMEQERTTTAGMVSTEEKEHFADFCLWKAFKDGVDREDAAWSSADFSNHLKDIVIAKGRPGWHLECSAMIRKVFGDNTIDLHGGGVDLKFPHHENEIAQSEGVTGKRFCNCWFHNGFVNIDNEKMSKSLGNFMTLRTACKTAEDVRAYRYLVVTSHYRNPLAFTTEVMQSSKSAVKRLDKVRQEIQLTLKNTERTTTPDASSVINSTIVPQALSDFRCAIADDLSMPRAAAALFALVKAAESEVKASRKGATM